jgi:hypothetical protein
MTDEELVKALRDFADDGYADLSIAAADRIELLATTNEQLVATNEALTAENKRLSQQCEGLMRAGMNNGQALILAEAKLATCEKYRDAYAECDSIGTQAVRDLEAKLAECLERNALLEARLGKVVEGLLLARVHVANNEQGWSVGRASARYDLKIINATLAEIEGEKG